MILAGVTALLLLAWNGGEGEMQAPPRPPQSNITFHQQVIVRVPTPPAQNQTPIRWEEHDGPRCIPWARIAGAALIGEHSVDLLLRDRTRLRARLGRRCPALDFYQGFYVSATPDGLICADRDSIRSRTGAECEIDRFRTLRVRRQR
jgi:hypothetical protein